jgi:hypothetical protein
VFVHFENYFTKPSFIEKPFLVNEIADHLNAISSRQNLSPVLLLFPKFWWIFFVLGLTSLMSHLPHNNVEKRVGKISYSYAWILLLQPSAS